MGYRSASQPEGLADVLERILDKGIVIAGDVSISLVGIELLTIRLRLLIATVDKAREMGIDWWSHDPYLNGRPRNDEAAVTGDNAALRERLAALEAQIAQLGAGPAPISAPEAELLPVAPFTQETPEPVAPAAAQPVFRRHKETP